MGSFERISMSTETGNMRRNHAVFQNHDFTCFIVNVVDRKGHWVKEEQERFLGQRGKLASRTHMGKKEGLGCNSRVTLAYILTE